MASFLASFSPYLLTEKLRVVRVPSRSVHVAVQNSYFFLFTVFESSLTPLSPEPEGLLTTSRNLRLSRTGNRSLSCAQRVIAACLALISSLSRLSK